MVLKERILSETWIFITGFTAVKAVSLDGSFTSTNVGTCHIIIRLTLMNNIISP